MSSTVLDASAILALLNDEPGADLVQQALPDALVSCINLAEVVTRLTLIGMPESHVREVISYLGLDVRVFDEEQAFQTGLLAASTHARGLSLGDRACLALALACNASALTADRAWKELELPVDVRFIR